MQSADSNLLDKFQAEVKSRLPHFEGDEVVNPTPLIDITQAIVECARTEYGIRLRAEGVRVYGKFDSKIEGGSVKVRPAAAIIEDAIHSGKLSEEQTVFEATSGNFGLALGTLRGLGVEVVALVSRKLQPGVIEKLKADGVRTINLDIDICPAPGLQGDADLLVARGIAHGVKQQLKELGFDTKAFDGVRQNVEELLARQDAIGLAKSLARAYGGFCPEQYDNELNAGVHRDVTGPEVDQQLATLGESLDGCTFVCAFGTGGTATGVSAYISSRYGRKGVRVVFPLSGQDVAGIRTREKAAGLKFYRPGSYLGEHEVDFEQTRKVFDYFNAKGFDVGESGALVLYSCIQMLNYGLESKLVAVVADGSSKYLAEVKTRPGPRKEQVGLVEASSRIGEYGGVVWAHNMFVPREEGVKVIAKSLGCREGDVRVAKPSDVQRILNGGEPSKDFEEMLPVDGKPILVVCMAGVTSRMLVKVLEGKGVAAESLMGGITGMPGSRARQPSELVQVSRG